MERRSHPEAQPRPRGPTPRQGDHCAHPGVDAGAGRGHRRLEFHSGGHRRVRLLPRVRGQPIVRVGSAFTLALFPYCLCGHGPRYNRQGISERPAYRDDSVRGLESPLVRLLPASQVITQRALPAAAIANSAGKTVTLPAGALGGLLEEHGSDVVLASSFKGAFRTANAPTSFCSAAQTVRQHCTHTHTERERERS